MKNLVLVLCFIAALSCAHGNRGDEVMTRLKLKYLESYIREREALSQVSSQLEQICPGSKLKFERALGEMKDCADLIDETSETSCFIVQHRLPKCIEPVMKVLRDCMPPKGKDVPDFFLKSVLKSVDYICKTDGEHIFELGNTCIYKNMVTLEVCKRKLLTRIRNFQDKQLGAKDVCSLMNYIRPCFKSHLSMSCGSKITQEAVIGVFDAFMGNCKEMNHSNEVVDVEASVNRLEDMS